MHTPVKTWLGVTIIVIITLTAGMFIWHQQKILNINDQAEQVSIPAKKQMVGGDRDEHGCLGSAGYSWCEEKQKCLRIWEEPCEAEDASNWQTYRNEKYGFEFQYPKDWKVDKERTSANEVVFSSSSQEIGESREAIEFERNVNNLALDQVLVPDSSIVKNISNMEIGEEKAIKINTTEFGTSYIIFLHKSNYYIITTMGGLFNDQILSTFKFVD